MAIRLLLLAGLLLDCLIVGLAGMNLRVLWVIVCISFGILIGLATIRGNGKVAACLCVSGIVAVPVFLLIRALPIHSFDWSPVVAIDSVTIELPSGQGTVQITDP